MKKHLIITVILQLLAVSAFADVYTTTGANTTWESAAAWTCTGTCGSATPGSFIDGHTITVNHPMTRTGPLSQGGTASGTLTVNDVLTVTTNFVLGASSATINGTGTINVGAEFRASNGDGHVVSVANLNTLNFLNDGSDGTDISSMVNVSGNLLFSDGRDLKFTNDLIVNNNVTLTDINGNGNVMIGSTASISIGGNYSQTGNAKGILDVDEFNVTMNMTINIGGAETLFEFGDIIVGGDLSLTGGHDYNINSIDVTGAVNLAISGDTMIVAGDFDSGSINFPSSSGVLIIQGDLNTGDVVFDSGADLVLGASTSNTANVGKITTTSGSTISGEAFLDFDTVTVNGGGSVCGETSQAFFDDRTAVDLSDCSFVLPIQLAYFNAQTKGGSVQFDWQTLSETGNDFFEVEYSIDGSSYFTLFTLDGAGDSYDILDYQYENANPSPRSEVVYYRLKQTDFDGSTSYSPVVPLNSNGNETGNIITVSPNPVDGIGEVRLSQFNDEKTYNAKLFSSNSLSSDLSFVIVNGKSDVDFSTVTSGMYFLNVEGINDVLKVLVY